MPPKQKKVTITVRERGRKSRSMTVQQVSLATAFSEIKHLQNVTKGRVISTAETGLVMPMKGGDA